jgi:hypothetical protein
VRLEKVVKGHWVGLGFRVEKLGFRETDYTQYVDAIIVQCDTTDTQCNCVTNSVFWQHTIDTKTHTQDTKQNKMEQRPAINYEDPSNSESDSIVRRSGRIANKTPMKMVSLREYISHDAEEDMSDKRLMWILCGVSESRQRIGVQVEEYRVRHTENSISTDIDSILISSADIPTMCDIQYFPFSSMHASLQLHNHLYHALDDETVRLSTIPNQMIGRFGDGGAYTLLEFFPNMRRKLESGRWMTTVDNGHRRRWYDEVLWPCLQQALPRHELVHWPGSYGDARERSTFQGTFNFQWYWMQQRHIQELSRKISERVEQLGLDGQVFANRFYHVFCRGVKLQSMKQGMEELERTRVDEIAPAVLHGVDMGMMGESEDILVDIGFECLPQLPDGAEAMTMIWARDRLGELMRKFIASPTRVRNDEFCSMFCLSGVAAEAAQMGSRGRFGVVYMQAYMNTKGPLYARMSDKETVRFSKSMTLDRALNGNEEYRKRVDIIRGGLQRGSTREWSARLELRLPYHRLCRYYAEIFDIFR